MGIIRYKIILGEYLREVKRIWAVLSHVHNPEIIRCHLCIGAFRVLIKQKRLCHASVKFGCAYVVFVGDGAVIRIHHFFCLNHRIKKAP